MAKFYADKFSPVAEKITPGRSHKIGVCYLTPPKVVW